MWYNVDLMVLYISTHTHTYTYTHTVEPGYNDIGLYNTSPIASDILIPINSTLLTVTVTICYNNTPL
jgi:hypothetical protein